MSENLKGCVACGAIYILPDTWYCDRCRCAGHTSRLKTEQEIISDLEKEHVKRYPIAVKKRKDLLAEMDSWQVDCE